MVGNKAEIFIIAISGEMKFLVYETLEQFLSLLRGKEMFS